MFKLRTLSATVLLTVTIGAATAGCRFDSDIYRESTFAVVTS